MPAKTALVVVDMLNTYEHADADALTRSVREVLSNIASLIERARADDDTAFVVKARHSIFFETPLEYLLRTSAIERLVLVGQVTEQCILYSALDAYIRHFQVVVPPDAVAAIHRELHDAALQMMRVNMDADLTPAADVRLS